MDWQQCRLVAVTTGTQIIPVLYIAPAECEFTLCIAPSVRFSLMPHLQIAHPKRRLLVPCPFFSFAHQLYRQ